MPDAVVVVAGPIAAELVVVGPEAPLAAGVADALIEAGSRCSGRPPRPPGSNRARRSATRSPRGRRADGRSAAFGRRARTRHRVRARARARRAGRRRQGDGLAAGKGVTVCDDVDEADVRRSSAPIGGAPIRHRGAARGR
jgi:phosphoribosylamine--glycine ligase